MIIQEMALENTEEISVTKRQAAFGILLVSQACLRILSLFVNIFPILCFLYIIETVS
jgi:hypothetical protein